MTAIVAQITTSLDGYVAGPNDGPGRGLGERGERLHYWVFGGPWSYDHHPATAAAGGKDISITGADVIRQVLAAGRLDELTVSVAPIVLGGGKRLFESFDQDVELDQVSAVQSPWVTHLHDRVRRG